MCVIIHNCSNPNKGYVTMVVYILYRLTKVKASVIYNIRFYHTFSSSEIPPAKERRPRRTHSSRALLSCSVCVLCCVYVYLPNVTTIIRGALLLHSGQVKGVVGQNHFLFACFCYFQTFLISIFISLFNLILY